MDSMLASSAVDRGFDARSGQTKDYKIGMCCFSAKHAALRSKSKDWLAWNQNNVSEWSDMSTRGLLFQWTSTIKSNSACWFRTKRTSSSSHWRLTCSRHDIAGNKQHSLTPFFGTKLLASIQRWNIIQRDRLFCYPQIKLYMYKQHYGNIYPYTCFVFFFRLVYFMGPDLMLNY